jgi:protein TonB
MRVRLQTLPATIPPAAPPQVVEEEPLVSEESPEPTEPIASPPEPKPDPKPPKEEPVVRPPEPDVPQEEAKQAPEEAIPPSPEELDFLEPEKVEPRAEDLPQRSADAAESKAIEEANVEGALEQVGMGAAVQASATEEGVDDFYLGLVQRKIGRRWQPSAASARGQAGVSTVVTFRIGPEGEVIAPIVRESSGLSVFDRQALRAVVDSAPLPAPPPRFSRSGLQIHFRFVYNPGGAER